VTEAVLDASVVVKWFRSEGEANVEVARTLRAQLAAGELHVLAPPLIWLELINVAARRWAWSLTKLEQLAQALTGLGFELIEPDIATLARWAASGLTTYDAAYVAVAEQSGAQLISDDAEIARLAPALTIALANAVAS
jgi:predicted nucleic acid-binding protein